MLDNFAGRLKMLRREAGLTQEELGNRLDVGRSAVANWERGTRNPSPMVMRSLAVMFGVSSDYLYGRTPERRHIASPPVPGIDVTKLNAEGVAMLAEFYRLLINDSRYNVKD